MADKVRTLTWEGAAYQVSNLRGILNPGKFEGEALHAVRDYGFPSDENFGSVCEDGRAYFITNGRHYVEDSQGFVTEITEEEYREDEKAWEEAYAAEQAREEAIAEAEAELSAAREEEQGSCDSCEVLMINGLRCHETGCPRFARLKSLEQKLEAIEEGL